MKNQNNQQHIIIFGAPGAGKGTHADLMAKRYGMVHLSTGDLLRKEVAEQTPLGKFVQKELDQGNLVADEIVIEMVEKAITGTDRNCILDGFPRTVAQAKALDEMMKRTGQHIRCVLSIEVPREELILRLEQRSLISHRSDDNEATILHRLIEYETKSKNVIDYYKADGRLVPVDASDSIENTQKNIRNALSQL
jgi:adenylate kinase